MTKKYDKAGITRGLDWLDKQIDLKQADKEKKIEDGTPFKITGLGYLIDKREVKELELAVADLQEKVEKLERR